MKKSIKCVRRSIFSSVYGYVWYGYVWASVYACVDNSVYFPVSDSVLVSVRSPVWDSVLVSVRSPVWDSVKGEIK